MRDIDSLLSMTVFGGAKAPHFSGTAFFWKGYPFLQPAICFQIYFASNSFPSVSAGSFFREVTNNRPAQRRQHQATCPLDPRQSSRWDVEHTDWRFGGEEALHNLTEARCILRTTIWKCPSLGDPPVAGGLILEFLLNWMIWWYPDFRTPPCFSLFFDPK